MQTLDMFGVDPMFSHTHVDENGKWMNMDANHEITLSKY
jgi:hypothetical protein